MEEAGTKAANNPIVFTAFVTCKTLVTVHSFPVIFHNCLPLFPHLLSVAGDGIKGGSLGHFRESLFSGVSPMRTGGTCFMNHILFFSC